MRSRLTAMAGQLGARLARQLRGAVAGQLRGAGARRLIGQGTASARAVPTPAARLPGSAAGRPGQFLPPHGNARQPPAGRPWPGGAAVADGAGAGQAPAGPGRSGHAAERAAPGRPAAAVTAARAAIRGQAAGPARHAARPPGSRAAAGKPAWYEVAQLNRAQPGTRHCGRLEALVHREWAAATAPAPELVQAITRLAELPPLIQAKLAAGLDAIHVGTGGVPDLDDMTHLSGVPLPGGRATWDACAGAYGNHKIIIGTRPSPSPDVTCHEVGHALDDLDGPADTWQSDSAEFHALYGECVPHMVSAFHRQPGVIGRREFFADAFAAIASRQRPALVEMLGGSTRPALSVMLYFNIRYGI